ncbi:acylphosphatase [Candidatus Woesebacteria bacterium]|nr:acylphosphatase [Candidatus Woesebacteria bacterium]
MAGKSKKNKNKAVKTIVSGRVQGVFYRTWTKNTAKSLHLNGWVRNLPDQAGENGRQVEAYFEGQKENIEKMVERCKKGSKFSDVKKIEIKWIEPEGVNSFEIRY